MAGVINSSDAQFCHNPKQSYFADLFTYCLYNKHYNNSICFFAFSVIRLKISFKLSF